MITSSRSRYGCIPALQRCVSATEAAGNGGRWEAASGVAYDDIDHENNDDRDNEKPRVMSSAFTGNSIKHHCSTDYGP